jgi:repressor of nif and glnA expression
MYHFGYATAGGLNPIEKVKESDVCVDVKSIEKIMDFKYFETF